MDDEFSAIDTLGVGPNDAFRNIRCDACYTAAVEFMKATVIPVVAYVLGTGSPRGSR